MRMFSSVLAIATSLNLVASAAQAETPRPQYVLISFDGAHDNKLWTRSRELAKNNNAHFTYFLSCVFLMEKKDRRDYEPPHKRAGASNVGFALSHDEVVTRLDNIWQAHLEGNEIASHGCGHFDGTDWTTADWDKEIKEFRRITADAYKNNGIAGEPEGWQEMAQNGINGFRAPYLAASKPVQDALKANGFRYQASSITRGPEAPKIDGSFASFGLPLIPEGPSQRPIVGMDYNLYVRHSRGKEAPAQAAQFEERTYKTFRAAFDKQYDGERIPLQLGFHFVLMNDGAYWRAMERLVSEVCNKPDVKCTTYNDYLNTIEAAGSDATQKRS
ncbi:polysaccharide deacetylase [Ochrobactrum sp. Marseille-Q0166]|uniref:polysaccharide deacetylase family protein n=2 Tax=Pseudomonadota TaxID=1224 RepID=UPI0016555EA5|nr:polysaccharide deacetylase [Ochrobactrum sp. Marseille-Q0166]MBC8718025.1 polysaccharide deacetylase [Ochrobactrum sp. Marseille-Q0166]